MLAKFPSHFRHRSTTTTPYVVGHIPWIPQYRSQNSIGSVQMRLRTTIGQFSNIYQIRSYCDGAEESGPSHIADQVLSAYQLTRLGKHQEAAELLSRLIEEQPKMVTLYNGRSLVYAEMKDWDRAIGDANKVIEINPKFGAGYSLLGKYTERTNRSKALEYFTTAIRYTPEARHYIARGSLYDTLGNYDRAMSDFNKAIEVNPKYGIGYVKRASLQRKQKKFQEALDDIIKAESLEDEYTFPEQAEIQDHKINLLLALKRTEEALELPKSLESPGLAAVLYAEIYNHLGDTEKALQYSNVAVEKNPNFSYVYIVRGKCYQQLHKNKEALDDFTKAIETQPGMYIGHYRRGNLLLEQKQYTKAIEDLTKATYAQPNSAEAFYALAKAYYHTKQFSKSMEAVNIGLQIDPENMDLLAHRAKINQSLSPDLALKDWTSFITRWPTDPWGYFQRGVTLVALGKYSEAANDLLKALELDTNKILPSRASLYHLLGSCYRYMKDFSTSLEYLDKAIELEPKNIASLHLRALVHIAMSDPLAALKDVNNAIKFSKEPVSALYSTRAIVYSLTHDPRAAEEAARAMELDQLQKRQDQLHKPKPNETT